MTTPFGQLFFNDDELNGSRSDDQLDGRSGFGTVSQPGGGGTFNDGGGTFNGGRRTADPFGTVDANGGVTFNDGGGSLPPYVGACRFDSDCPIGLSCDPNDGVCKETLIRTTPTTAQCDPQGTFLRCVGDGVGEFSGGFQPGNAICPTYTSLEASCIEPRRTPPTPTLECPAGTTLCGGISYTNNIPSGMCCPVTDNCCVVNGESMCVSGPCPGTVITQQRCPDAGTLESCISTNGLARVYTGQRDSSGECVIGEAISLTCLECPERGQFLGCIGAFGDYSNGKIPGFTTCTSYQVPNDPACVPPPPPDIIEEPVACGGSRFGACPQGQVCTPTIGSSNSAVLTRYVCISIPDEVESVPTVEPPVIPTVEPTAPPLCQANKFKECNGTIGIYYTGQVAGGVCQTFPLENDSQCAPPPPPSPDPIIDSPPPRVFWRNCVTGDLVEGTPPSQYRQIPYNGAGGGLCWEPISDLGFNPSLNNALQYQYQRGSSIFPESKTIVISNSSYGLAYEVKINTNPDIMLSTDKLRGSKGSIAFTIAPRSETTLSIIVTQELLQKLQDGTSTLSMNVEYDQVGK